MQALRDYIFFLIYFMKRPDIIHLTSSAGLATIQNLIFCRTASLFHIPIVFHLHVGRLPEIVAKKTIEWVFLSYVIRSSDITIAITPMTVKIIKEQLPDCCVFYIPNPIDLEEMKGFEKKVTRIKTALFLGWVLPSKGVEELLDAWTNIVHDDWELIVAGPVNVKYKEYLLNKYRPVNTRFIGELRHENALKVLSDCDLFILPSYSEGFPNVILEAMALGKPILSTAVGAIPEILSEGCGLLVRPRSVLDLERGLRTLIPNTALREQIGAKAHRKVYSHYGIDEIFRSYVEVWEGLIGEKIVL